MSEISCQRKRDVGIFHANWIYYVNNLFLFYKISIENVIMYIINLLIIKLYFVNTHFYLIYDLFMINYLHSIFIVIQ